MEHEYIEKINLIAQMLKELNDPNLIDTLFYMVLIIKNDSSV